MSNTNLCEKGKFSEYKIKMKSEIVNLFIYFIYKHMSGYNPSGFGYPPSHLNNAPVNPYANPPLPLHGVPPAGYPPAPLDYSTPNTWQSPPMNPPMNYYPPPSSSSPMDYNPNPSMNPPMNYGVPQQPMYNQGQSPMMNHQPYAQHPYPSSPSNYPMNSQIQPYNGSSDYSQEQYDRASMGGHGGLIGKFSNVVGGFMGSSNSIQQLLKTASEHAIRILGATDGYFHHAVAKILLPPKLNVIASLAQKFGLQSYVEKFILSMNRAAEQAASKALPIFHRFISSLSVNDVASLVGAKDTEATDYFRQQTERDLEQAYAPVVSESMNNWQVTRQFQELQSQTRHIPGIRNFNIDIHEYTIKKALSGLFYVLGEQERKLRQNPTGQVSNIMNHIFKK